MAINMDLVRAQQDATNERAAAFRRHDRTLAGLRPLWLAVAHDDTERLDV
ncbi:MAG: hypothetical protein OXG95_06350 [Chloroflexi bacterium]|nr:hypothetical protein [Chloroflexota bacterium]